MEISVVIPMGGLGKRFSDAGYTTPKPLIPVLGKPMILGVIDDFAHPRISNITLVTREQVLPREESESLVDQITDPVTVSIHYINALSEGPADTVRAVCRNLDPAQPLIVANSDQKIIGGMGEFIEACVAEPDLGRIATLDSRDEKWSFVRLDDSGSVIQVAEKKVISNIATAGIYYFPTASLFLRGLELMESVGDRTNGELYVAPIYNYLQGVKTRVWHMSASPRKFFGLGTPEDLDAYIKEMGTID